LLVYFDESGHPRPSDPTTRPVILAVCVKEKDAGRLIRALFSLRRTHLGTLKLTREEREGKAAALLDRRSLTKLPAKREYAESLFSWLRDFDLTTFGIVMERPTKAPYEGSDILSTQHRWLLERIDRFMEREHPDEMAIPIFDGQDPVSNRNFADCFTGFMARSKIGRAMQHVVPSPLFVDSSLTPGIQIADSFAYVTRLSYEHNLRAGAPSDPYLSAIRRYSVVVREKTINYEREDGLYWYGISTMDSSKFQYERTEVVISEDEPPEESSGGAEATN
jgi:uncharacterized protein DUF3800